MEDDQIRLIADSMLGRLARWLRILGYDTYYKRDIPDPELIRIAKQEERVILTKDTGIALKAKEGLRCILVTSDSIKDQLKQVLAVFKESGFKNSRPFTRCPLCNGILLKIKKTEVLCHVPDYIYLKNSDFSRCHSCNRIYWSGSHEARIMDFIKKII